MRLILVLPPIFLPIALLLLPIRLLLPVLFSPSGTWLHAVIYATQLEGAQPCHPLPGPPPRRKAAIRASQYPRQDRRRCVVVLVQKVDINVHSSLPPRFDCFLLFPLCTTTSPDPPANLRNHTKEKNTTEAEPQGAERDRQKENTSR